MARILLGLFAIIVLATFAYIGFKSGVRERFAEPAKLPIDEFTYSIMKSRAGNSPSQYARNVVVLGGSGRPVRGLDIGRGTTLPVPKTYTSTWT